MKTTIEYGETELEVRIEFMSATSISPSGRIDWSEEEYAAVEFVYVEDGKGKEWDMYSLVDSDVIEKIESDYAESCYEAYEEAKYDAWVDAQESRYGL